VKRTRNATYYLAASVALATFLVYLPALQNELIVNRDDGVYIIYNTHIRSLDMTFFKWAFTDFYESYLHPLTWISHAVDYAIWGLNPLGHHLTNIILHAVNTFAVVFLIIRLLEVWQTRTMQPSSFLTERTILLTAGVTGLLFGIHPLHVESVAWVSERKDLLCALFYLLSIIAYTKYAGGRELEARSQKAEVRSKTEEGRSHQSTSDNRQSARYYILTLVFFVLALMSKPMAVTLPVVLLILDWYPFNRIQSFRALRAVVVEKLPLIALSLIASMLAVLAQKSVGAMILSEVVPLSTRLLVAAKALVVYLWKMIWPLDLSPYYSYPKNMSLLSVEAASAIALVIGITAACAAIPGKRKLLLSVWGYYIVTLMPVLGIIQVGEQSMADRYTYLPSLGPFLVIGLCVTWFSGKANSPARGVLIVKLVSTALAFFIILSLSFLTFKQIAVWKNDLAFWNSVIAKESDKILVFYYYRGQAFASRGQYQKAIEDYDTVIALNYKKYSKVYITRGLTYQQIGQVEPAISDFKEACDLGDNFGCKSMQYLMQQEPSTRGVIGQQREK
jgi:protein O-mannosyl-transferase